jgi:hypothetical protein
MLQLRSQNDISSLCGAIISGKVTSSIITNQLIETPHPCTYRYSNTWNITGPMGATKMRPHFTKIQNLNSLLYYYATGTSTIIYPANINAGTWTDWIPGNQMTIYFYNYGTSSPYGFQMDKFESLVPLAGVTLTLTPGNITTTTDANGNFFFENIAPGTYTVTPSMNGKLFSPSNQGVTVTQGQIKQDINFTAN